MLSLRGLTGLAALVLLTSCQTIPGTDVYSVPSFPSLVLQDNPNDPKGFCLSSEEAAKLGIYINQLEGMLSESTR